MSCDERAGRRHRGPRDARAELTDDRIHRRTIQPPELVDETSDARGYILVARDADIEAMVEILFPPPGDRPTTGKVTRYVSDEPARELQRASC